MDFSLALASWCAREGSGSPFCRAGPPQTARRVSVTKVGGSLETPSSLKKSRPKSIRFAEIHRYIGKNKEFGEKGHLGQHPVSPGQHSESVRIEVGEIRSEEQINILLTSISAVFGVTKHSTNTGDAHPFPKETDPAINRRCPPPMLDVRPVD